MNKKGQSLNTHPVPPVSKVPVLDQSATQLPPGPYCIPESRAPACRIEGTHSRDKDLIGRVTQIWPYLPREVGG